ISSNIRDNHRQTHCHLLEYRIGEAFLVRAQETNIRCPQEIGYVASLAEPEQVVLKTARNSIGSQRSANAVVTTNAYQSPLRRQVRMRDVQCCKEISMSLVWDKVSDLDEN